MWSWFLSIGGITLTLLVGKKFWWAWAVALVLNILWCIYSIDSHQYGFLLASGVYFVVYWNNLVSWWKDDQKSKNDPKKPDLS